MKRYNLKAYLILLSAALSVTLASCKDDAEEGNEYVEQSTELGENLDIAATVTVQEWDDASSAFANLAVDWSERNEVAIFSQSSANAMYRITTEATAPTDGSTEFSGIVNISEGDMMYALYPSPEVAINSKGIYVDISDQSLVEQHYAGASLSKFDKEADSEFTLYSQLAKVRVNFLISENLDVMSDLDYVQLTSTSFYTARYLSVESISTVETVGWSGGVKSSKGLIIDPEEVTKSDTTKEIDGKNYYTYSFDLYLFPFAIETISFTFYDKKEVKIYTGEYTIYSEDDDVNYVTGTISQEDFKVPNEELVLTIPYSPTGVQNEDNTMDGTENGGSLFDPDYEETAQPNTDGGDIDDVTDSTFN